MKKAISNIDLRCIADKDGRCLELEAALTPGYGAPAGVKTQAWTQQFQAIGGKGGGKNGPAKKS